MDGPRNRVARVTEAEPDRIGQRVRLRGQQRAPARGAPAEAGPQGGQGARAGTAARDVGEEPVELAPVPGPERLVHALHERLAREPSLREQLAQLAGRLLALLVGRADGLGVGGRPRRRASHNRSITALSRRGQAIGPAASRRGTRLARSYPAGARGRPGLIPPGHAVGPAVMHPARPWPERPQPTRWRPGRGSAAGSGKRRRDRDRRSAVLVPARRTVPARTGTGCGTGSRTAG